MPKTILKVMALCDLQSQSLLDSRVKTTCVILHFRCVNYFFMLDVKETAVINREMFYHNYSNYVMAIMHPSIKSSDVCQSGFQTDWSSEMMFNKATDISWLQNLFLNTNR